MKTNRIPFSLEKYESGKYKVVTRDGKNVRIVCTDMKSYQPIIAIARVSENEELYSSFSLKGELNENGETSIFDLFLKETVFEDGDIIYTKNSAVEMISIFNCFDKNKDGSLSGTISTKAIIAWGEIYKERLEQDTLS